MGGDRGLMINMQMYHDVSPRLHHCNLTEKSCSYLASALTSHSSSLTQLELWGNNLRASDVEQLSALVNDPHYKLEKLM